MVSTVHSTTRLFKVASIPGDGIGTEITAAAVQVLTQLAKAYGTFEFVFTEFDWSSKNYETRGWYMPDDGIQQLQRFDAIYFGAVGWPSVPDHISLWGLILPIRKAVFEEVKREYEGSGVVTDKMLVDAMTVRMVNKPQSLDTIVATNLHADILSDLAAALAGSIGIAPSANLDPTRRFPSMFEPIHGSAPDIAGKGVANPLGALWSAAEMVRWLGGADETAQAAEGVTKGPGVGRMAEAADVLMKALENVTANGVATRDLGGKNITKEVTDAVCAEIEKLVKS
ncbi:hypothetical protein FH972_021588 [Carpinus fangiana]|uniref:Isopropylmalate dehydrogenase-like domain-containing protein n=1 Tax=Carpinus fangiana TaxID=176857 RepID=A0A5N6KRX3_9ROSI|nr:hypothetical protein FH972_021588 [Carpinus fangiana]